jgi:hypothetical protein
MGAKTDFTAMPDNDLRRWIARRRGWTEVEWEEWFVEDYDRYDPAEGLIATPPAEIDPRRDRRKLPDWTGDLNAAWELFVELPRGVLYRCNERAGVEYMIDYLTLRSITAAQPARAIAEAWARWKDQDHDD